MRDRIIVKSWLIPLRWGWVARKGLSKKENELMDKGNSMVIEGEKGWKRV